MTVEDSIYIHRGPWKPLPGKTRENVTEKVVSHLALDSELPPNMKREVF